MVKNKLYDLDRKQVKVHKDISGIKIILDLSKKEIVHTDKNYRTFYLTKFNVEDIVYDDRVTACFYDDDRHPLAYILGKNFISMARMFSMYGMSVMINQMKDGCAHILVFPKEKVKTFKE